MARQGGYRVERISRARLALAAGQEMAHGRHLMFGLVEADLTEPLRRMDEHKARYGERLSLAGYVTTCLARTLREFPEVNAFRRGRSVVLLDEVIVVVLVERSIDSQSAVGYLPIRHADTKSLSEVTREIRAEQASPPRVVPGQQWLERLPAWVAPIVMRWATRSIGWALRFGTAGVNNIGFGALPGWGLAPGAGTVAVTVGGISPEDRADGRHRIGHLTLTFDHDVVDGAPAARFTSRLLAILESGETVADPS
ncbi:MAG TPA: 2-oxo acid dehydrogenase subunit E2 [Propionibacteriaceae bacterium]|nr:2-oxo acid dehydrogenase subunit E2 [Propionibacteriaceae bacterium]